LKASVGGVSPRFDQLMLTMLVGSGSPLLSSTTVITVAAAILRDVQVAVIDPDAPGVG
jgi:hypothetical protein